MRAVIVLMLAASPLALAAPADAQSVIQDGRWVTGKPKPTPTPPPPPPAPVEQAATVASAPATVPDAPIAAPPAAPAPRFAPRAEVVQPLPPAPKPPVARAAAAPPPPPALAPGEAGAMPPPPPVAAPAARAEAPPPPPPGATYAPPAKPLPPVRRADAPPPPPPPKPQRAPERRADAPPPPPRAHHKPGHHADARPMPHHARAAHADAKPHRAPKHRWGEHRDGRWEGGWNAPGGWGAYRRPAQGWSLPRYWWAPEFVVVDHWTYDLAPPMQGDRWVRYYDDAVLVDRHGEVIDWVEGIDWNDAGGAYYADDRDGYYDDYAGDYGADYAPPGYPAGGYIANGYYYPPAVTHTIRIDSEPVATSRTYVTEEVVTTRGKGGKSYRRVQTKKCNC